MMLYLTFLVINIILVRLVTPNHTCVHNFTLISKLHKLHGHDISFLENFGMITASALATPLLLFAYFMIDKQERTLRTLFSMRILKQEVAEGLYEQVYVIPLQAKE